MKVRLFLHIILLFTFISHGAIAQEEIRDQVELQVDFRNESGKVQVKIQNSGHDINQPLQINLDSFDLRIRFVNYKADHLVKFYLEDELECDGLEFHIDSHSAASSIVITKGLLNLVQSYRVGSAMSIVLPDKNLRLLIRTGKAALTTCPDAAGIANGTKTTGHKIGVPYYDAVYLRSGTDLAIKKEILIYYAGVATATGSCEQILDNLKENQFLFPYAEKLCREITQTGVQQGTFSVSSLVNSVSGIDVTTIANGVSMFMIKRAKEELTISFFNHFKVFVANNTEFQVLFPKTTENLGNLLAYRYPEMLPALRSGFFQDLDKITYRLDDVLELPRYADLLRNFPEIRVTIRSLRLVHEIESGDSHPADILTQFADLPEWGETGTTYDFRNFGSSVKLASVFSQSVRNEPEISGDTTRAWITLKELKQLVADDTTFKIYLGFVYQMVKRSGVIFWVRNSSRPFDSIMLARQNNIFLFENKLTEFLELAAKVDKVRNDLRASGKNNIPLKNEDYYSYINTSLDVIEYGFSIAILFDHDFSGTDYTRIARNCNDLYRHVYKKEYSQAITNSMQIYRQIADLLRRSRSKLDTSAAMRKSLDSLATFTSKATKYALFMANMADADSPEEVEAILDNAVLPVGSSSIKKNSEFNISIQSYLGAYVRFGNLKYQTNAAWSDPVGISAPIGIAFSWGFERYGSLSLFGSLFDLGAIVDYRLKNDTLVDPNGNPSATVEKDYKIEFGQIISPGAYVVYGFGFNLPLSLGIGGQWGPGLSRVSVDGSSVVNNPQWRWNIIFGVDIPFFTIRNKMKNYKKEDFVYDR